MLGYLLVMMGIHVCVCIVYTHISGVHIVKKWFVCHEVRIMLSMFYLVICIMSTHIHR